MTPYFIENKQMRGIKSKLLSQAIKLFDLNIFLANKIHLLKDFPTLPWVQDYISSHFCPKEDRIDVFKVLCYRVDYTISVVILF